jgi:hypothetical protein
MKRLLLLVFIIPVLVSTVQSQDTINLLNGKQIAPKTLYNDENKAYIRCDLQKRNHVKLKVIDLLDVYSIKYTNKPELVVYKRDSMNGNNLTPEEMRLYVKGERTAEKIYKAPFVTAAGVVVGFVPTIYILNFYGLISPALYGITMGVITPKAKIAPGDDPMLLTEKNYVDGYKMAATRKKVKNAVGGAIAGVLAAALTAYTLYYLNN